MHIKKINFNTINWRLPFSYAVIALITALTLGSVMLLVLNSYYSKLEQAYLLNNANTLQPIIESLLQSDVDQAQLNQQLHSLAFLTNVQIQITDPNNQIIANSGPPYSIYRISIEENTNGNVLFGMTTSAKIINDSNAAFIFMDTDEQFNPFSVTIKQPIETIVSISSTPSDEYLFSDSLPADQTRYSSQVLKQPLEKFNYQLEFSNGPAYGYEILRSVAIAWFAAAILSLFIAIISGLIISRQVTNPVLTLMGVTLKMEQGELSSRVELPAVKMHEFQQLANSYNHMADRIEKTISTLRIFVSDAAHELNTPLTALKINLEIAQNEHEPEIIKKYLNNAHQNTLRLEQLAGSLLDLSRIETIASDTLLHKMNITPLIEQLFENYASRVEQKGISFLLELSENEIMINGNAGQLTRAINNLLENALKFTPIGEKIQVKLDEEKGQMVLTIADTGMGIPEQDFPHLFERFHRGRNSTGYPGNGLGLAIVKAVAITHHGEVSAEPKATGSCFRFTIPITV